MIGLKVVLHRCSIALNIDKLISTACKQVYVIYHSE